MAVDEPLRKTLCETCPFKPGSPYANLAPGLTLSALTEATRICHSTGSDNAINKRTGLPPHICRGARDIQLQYFAVCGVITDATDEAWNEGRVKAGMPPTVTADPIKEKT